MTGTAKNLLGAATVFAVGDLAASLAYYRGALGFDLAFEYGEPTYYAGVCRDEVEIHLIDAARAKRQAGEGAIAIFVADVDAIFAELAGRGARIGKPPQDSAYGMRDFIAPDLDGNRLTFGAAIDQS